MFVAIHRQIPKSLRTHVFRTCWLIGAAAVGCVFFALSSRSLAVAHPPLPAGVAALPKPPGTVLSVITQQQEILGGPSYFYSFEKVQDGGISGQSQKGKWFDKDWQELCDFYKGHRGLTFLDVGANIGTLSVPVARCLWELDPSRTSSVISIEADPVNAKVLQANYDVNKIQRSVVVNKGLGDVAGTTHFAKSGGGNSQLAAPGEVGEDSGVSIELMTLDSLYEQFKPQMSRVLAMKMDIEGYEGKALLPAKKFLSEAPPCYIKVELIPLLLDRRFGTPILEIMGLLGSMNYTFYPLDNDWAYGQRNRDFWFQQSNIEKCVRDRLNR